MANSITPESIRKALRLGSVFNVEVTTVKVIVSGPRYRALYTHSLTLISFAYFDSKEVS